MKRIEFPDVLFLEDGTELRKINTNSRYYAGSNGTIYSKKPSGLLPLKPYVIRSGYSLVNIYDGNGGCKHKLVHRLVADKFVPNPEGKPSVDHIDGNKQNNAASNLEFVTRSENTQRAYRTGLLKPTWYKAVILTDMLTGDTKSFASVKECVEHLGCSQSTVSQALIDGYVVLKRYKVEYIDNGGK